MLAYEILGSFVQEVENVSIVVVMRKMHRRK
mgnify:CR=1 FL=1